MALEIERKFLVKSTSMLNGLVGVAMKQAYLADDNFAVRVRLTHEKCSLTVKSTNGGLTRSEFEYEIPSADAQAMFDMPGILGKLKKVRFSLPVEGVTFEVDVYAGALKGLVTAEVELSCEDQAVPSVDWLGREVSHDREFSNASLARFGLPVDWRWK